MRITIWGQLLNEFPFTSTTQRKVNLLRFEAVIEERSGNVAEAHVAFCFRAVYRTLQDSQGARKQEVLPGVAR